ncbi:LysR family transcriptional regulator [Burkholderia alba]|uniref:LysR family transcriptional regulator n=1 Tax=Burkholderia alba TaxID=2683677 RepID=UPI002B053857|nr:LysR family transcriptional regulator [Burkholderia alba]
MPRNLDTSLLRTFVTVARCSSMTAAAHALHLTQGAISQQIKRLEACFGQQMFDRNQRRLKLTEAGERLLDRAEGLVRLNDQIWVDMTGVAFSGTIRVGAPPDLVGTYLAGILKAFSQSYPHVEIVLVSLASGELIDALRDGQVDVAIVEQTAGESGGECLRREPLAWVGARGGGAYMKRPLAVSVVSDVCVFRPVLFDALSKHGVTWRTVFENGDIEATRATVRMDMAVTAWLVSTVPPELQILSPLAGLPELPDFAITLHMSPSGVTPLAEEMAKFIRSSFLNAPGAHGERAISAADRAA